MLARLTKMQEENEEGFTLIELLVVIMAIPGNRGGMHYQE